MKPPSWAVADRLTQGNPGPLFDRPAPVHAGASSTERAAAERVGPALAGLRADVLDWITSAGDQGLTAKEAGAIEAHRRGLPETDGKCRYTVAPRFPELARAHLIEQTPFVREGCRAWKRISSDPKGV